TLPGGAVVEPRQVLGEARAGRKLVVSGDTRPARSVLEAAIEADLLVHEAAELARLAGVRMLALTHLSNRYFGPELAREARAVFPDTVVPRDFDIIELPFAERGAPTLVERGARPPRPMIRGE